VNVIEDGVKPPSVAVCHVLPPRLIERDEIASGAPTMADGVAGETGVTAGWVS
jgi:hypothetical protein